MVRKLFTAAALAASIAATMTPVAAMAHDHDRNGWDEGRYQDGGGDWHRHHQDDDRSRDWRGYDRRSYYDQGYGGGVYYDEAGYDQGYYAQPRYRYRCHRDGTTGTIIGAIAGGLLGNGLAGRGDHTLGTILGGGAGALAGRAIDRSGNGC